MRQQTQPLVKQMRNLWAIAIIAAATPSAMAETARDKALAICLTEALTDYTKAQLAFDASRGAIPSLTIDYFMAKRRLEESYCVRYARCIVSSTNIPDTSADVVAGTQFAKCLEDESEERAKLVK